jgi:hypothetical protein
MYHRVVPRSDATRDAVESGIFVSPETFARHLAWLDESFAVMPLPEIVSRLRDGRTLPRGACAITFDDDISRTRAEFFRRVPGSARAGVGAER